MSDQLKSIGFATIVALVCSLLLTAAATGLKERKLRNVAVDRQKNILKAVGLVTLDQQPTDSRVEQLYRDNIRCYALDGSDQVVAKEAQAADLPVCFHVEKGQALAYILPVESRGLWGTIRGYMAIDNDGKTVAGFSVYSHNETPGLGGEIEKPWFQSNFEGKQIVDASGAFAPIGIAKGKVADTIAVEQQANYVDGISGATLTGKYLTGGLREVLLAYEGLSERFRSGTVPLPAGD